jgi:hypothetical protein
MEEQEAFIFENLCPALDKLWACASASSSLLQQSPIFWGDTFCSPQNPNLKSILSDSQIHLEQILSFVAVPSPPLAEKSKIQCGIWQKSYKSKVVC